MAKIDLNDYLEKLTEPEDRETVANRAYQRELFEQYVTKDGNFPEQRAQLLEDFRAGKELTGPKGLRRKLGAFDLEYFGRAYLAHYFVRPSPKFHGELDRICSTPILRGGWLRMDEFTALFSRKDMTFEEAVAYFKERVPVTASRFYQIAAEYRALAFTVSGYTKAQVLKKFYDELLAALEEGNSLAEFRENMNDFLEAEGYEGITPYQAENIFRTNIQTAYNVGHYKRMTEPGVKALRPYWQYDAVNDSKTRPSHLAMDGRVFMADDPIWDTWFPPNGFKCRCTVKTLSKRQMEQRGLTVETEAPRAARLEDGRFVNILPDPQFDTNPAKVRYQPDLTGYPEPLKKAYQEREKGNTPP